VRTVSEEEDWEHEYPEGSLGWKINRKIDAIEAQPLKSGAVFLFIFAAFFTPVVVEIFFHPFQTWLEGFQTYSLAFYNALQYAVILLFIGGFFFYYGVRLVWHGLKLSKR